MESSEDNTQGGMKSHFGIQMLSFDSDEEMWDHVSSEEFNAPFIKYINDVMDKAQDGMDETDRVEYQKVMRGGSGSQTNTEGRPLHEYNPRVYDAVMWSICQGLG